MLTTIQELEREIDQFHKNIKDSNELMKILLSVTSLTKSQTETFENRTKVLQDELAKLSPELSDSFQKKVDVFIQEAHDEYQSYQDMLAKLMDGYANKFEKAESSLASLPSSLEVQLEKNRTENVAGLKQIQEQYAVDLATTNETFAKNLQTVTESVQSVPEQISEKSNQQYSIFLSELEKMMATRLNQFTDIEKRVVDLSKQLEEKYDAFENNTKVLQDELAKLSPELSDSFQKKVDVFIQEAHDEYQSYQDMLAKLMDGYANKFEKAESSLASLPSSLEVQLEKNRTENVAGLKQIQEQYAVDLATTNETFAKNLQTVTESVQSVPEQISEKSNQQYSIFLSELEKMMATRLNQFTDIEKRVVDLSKQLEEKYDAFVAKLEATNVDQLYKYCQNMNKSINTKLGLALGGVVAAVIVSIISLFI